MLRKILTSCLFLILFPLGAFAISYDELKNNPTKYILVYQSPRATAWVDVDSIRVTRYKLPELNIDTDFYTVVKNTHIIVKDNRSFSYDLDQAAAIRLKEIEKKHPDYTEAEKSRALTFIQISQSGISMNAPSWEIFNFTGEPYPEITGALDFFSRKGWWTDAVFDKIPWDVANYIFSYAFDSKYTLFGIPGAYATYI